MFPLLELLQLDNAVHAEQCIIAGLPSCDLQDGAPAVPAQGAGGRGVAGDAGGGEGHQEGAGEAQGGGKKEGGYGPIFDAICYTLYSLKCTLYTAGMEEPARLEGAALGHSAAEEKPGGLLAVGSQLG